MKHSTAIGGWLAGRSRRTDREEGRLARHGDTVSFFSLWRRGYLSSRANNWVSSTSEAADWERWRIVSAEDAASRRELADGDRVCVVSVQWQKALTARKAVQQYPVAVVPRPEQVWRLRVEGDGRHVELGTTVLALSPLATDPARAGECFLSAVDSYEIWLADRLGETERWILEEG